MKINTFSIHEQAITLVHNNAIRRPPQNRELCNTESSINEALCEPYK